MPLEHLLELISRYGYGGIAVLLALGIVGLPFPDETLLTLTGYLIFQGTLHPVPAYLSALLGSCCGITVSFAAGRYGALRLVRRFGSRIRLSEEHLAKGRMWFERRGGVALTLGYFVPGLRHVIAIIAGGTGLGYPRFAAFAYSGAGIWTAVFISAGFLLGKSWERFPDLARTLAVILFILFLVIAGVYIFLKKFRAKK